MHDFNGSHRRGIFLFFFFTCAPFRRVIWSRSSCFIQSHLIRFPVLCPFRDTIKCAYHIFVLSSSWCITITMILTIDRSVDRSSDHIVCGPTVCYIVGVALSNSHLCLSFCRKSPTENARFSWPTNSLEHIQIIALLFSLSNNTKRPIHSPVCRNTSFAPFFHPFICFL